MEEIQVNGFLNQKKLQDILIRIFGEENFMGAEIPAIPDTRTRFDMAFRKNETIFIVEVDGDEHYRNTLKIRVDNTKDVWAKEQGYTIVRVPYWVQLDNSTFQYFFGFELERHHLSTNFNHGFITTKILPASFCEMGIKRFENELNHLPITIKADVIDSLRVKVELYGLEYVLPESLRHLID